ncbi:MAG: sigma 54-interacting transcriptional regulator [Proteobacteria bacterium]|nr:sigma 54-interacting transcriptional regulator [Pseudomonadota bacterium]MBU2517378.1 sigma 54-interacting transcriptional regulator [Pseudomonadota bacterium]
MYEDLIQEQFEAIFNSSFDGIWICDGQGRILRCNPAAERMNGIKVSDYIGQFVDSLVTHGVIKDKTVTSEVLRHKRQVTMMQEVRTTGKKLLVTGSPIFDGSGNVVLVVTNDRDITELDNLRHQLLEKEARAQRYESELLKRDLEKSATYEVVGNSPLVRGMLAAASHVAPFKTTVLLTGESGTGKGLLANAIHRLSGRHGKPFTRIDCGAIPATLFESELFGYEGGAFTGAKAGGKIGLLELADQGTIFLDEIALIPMEVQHKLLRFLEKGEMIRVGGSGSIRVSARVVTATNLDLEVEVAAGRFREDLYYRINVVPIHVPSLKERAEDIPLLAGHFLKRFNKKHGNAKEISAPVLESLMQYDWPGNVRELENLLERLVVMSRGHVIELVDLPSKMIRRVSQMDAGAQLARGNNLKNAVREFEQAMITLALAKYGTQARAAEVLGVSQATVARKKQP